MHCQGTELGICVVDNTGRVEFADVDEIALEAQAEVGGDFDGVSVAFVGGLVMSSKGPAYGFAICGMRSIAVSVLPEMRSLKETALKHELEHVLLGGLCDPDHEVVR